MYFVESQTYEVSEECVFFIFSFEGAEQNTSMKAGDKQSVVSEKIVFFIATGVSTSNVLPYICLRPFSHMIFPLQLFFLYYSFPPPFSSLIIK
jgi:hypothetical protein